MVSYYRGMVAMKADADTLDYTCEDELSFEVPGVYYEGVGVESEEGETVSIGKKILYWWLEVNGFLTLRNPPFRNCY